MKRTIRHPDGRVEEQEGTPAEFREVDAPPPPVVPQPLGPPEVLKNSKCSLCGDVRCWGGCLYQYTTSAGHRQRCLFDGLPPGVYHIACPCPLHTTWCMT